ncbi:APC family permease [Mycobacterium sp. ACS4331]|uniref:APC family permease n=1 Tax=Mycobacterium sp. ACS4331 TaxID=1834121 RepID=UPI0008024DB9|nr:APC family permease [Mycobacterium sp. ACS4331]OBF17871.1 transporter [Mycobacterium sp. ACS4331]
MPSTHQPDELRRSLGVIDAVAVGLGAMLGAGIFAALGPAARAAGSGLLIGLAIACGVAYCNAMSSARLAVRYPVSGGTYVYGRERLGDFWGHLAGWGFVVGKTASCAAMALTVGSYAWPDHAREIAVAVVVAMTALNCVGVQKSAWVTRGIVAVVLAVLAAVVVAVFSSGAVDAQRLAVDAPVSVPGILQAAGLLFFAFAGYARIATMAEEVRDPGRVIPRAVGIALALTLIAYVAVATAVLGALGPDGLAASAAPVVDAVRAAEIGWLVPVVGVAAVSAAGGALLTLLLGVSRTTLAMARDGHLPAALAAVHPRHAVPQRAEIAIGLVVAILAATVDLRSAIGFSSFAVLVYYAIANASAFTLAPGRARVIPIVGGIGCAVLAFTLPVASVLAGAALLALGAAVFLVRRGRTG